MKKERKNGIGKSKMILVVDDDFKDLLLIKNILDKEGYITQVATNGAQAFDFIKKENFDLVTIDIQMPTMSGYDLLRLLRESFAHKTKMIYISVIPKKDVDMRDVDGFVQKPYSSETLINVVRRVLKSTLVH